MYYWEYLLDFLYYRKDITIVDEWKNWNTNIIVPTKEFSLKKSVLNQIQINKNV